MLICIFGESCTGKSTLAARLLQRDGGAVYTGKDYLRLARNEAEAREAFRKLLAEAVSGDRLTIFVTTELEGLELLPAGCTRVLVTAPLSLIRERFARRTGGKLPPAVAAMLEKRHGCFDAVPHDFHVESGEADIDAILSHTAR